MNKTLIWCGWLVITIGLGIFFGNKLFGEGDKSTFLIGEATYGHYQIEMACESCHSAPFGGGDVLQDACTNCHGAELEEAHDSHPKKKFTDPRNADRIEILDARYCVNCHTEHQKEQTHAMGLTMPEDYCFHCHEDLGEERPSHEGLAFDTCASAGCHNYHDNRALYEDFLVDNGHQPWLHSDFPSGQESMPSATSVIAQAAAVTKDTSNFPQKLADYPEVADQWQHSSHAKAGVDCGGCHLNDDEQWLEQPDFVQCRSCHAYETTGFLSGKHGMRLSGKVTASLEPVSPKDSHLPFTVESQNLTHGCNACHGAHEFDPADAAVDGCLGCHQDDHSLAFKSSPHGQLWAEVGAGLRQPETAVTCATCHMPKLETRVKGKKVLAVQHNQNWNLRPNEKMIRPVCMNCHGLAFAIDALADPNLIENNFSGQPSEHIPTIDWALDRVDPDRQSTY